MIKQRALPIAALLAVYAQGCADTSADSPEFDSPVQSSGTDTGDDELVEPEASFQKSLVNVGTVVYSPNSITGMEAEAFLPAHYGLQAIGARVAGSAVTTIHLWGREFRPDGTLGAVMTLPAKGGSAPDSGLEVPKCALPHPDAFITNIKGRISDGNMVMLRIWGRRYDPVTRDLTTDIYRNECGSQKTVSAEREIDATWSNQGWWKNVITGVGMRELGDSLNNMKLYLADPQ